MSKKKFFTLPKLNFDYDALWPYMTEEQLRTHHQKHHQAYVDNANNLLEKWDQARIQEKRIELKNLSKSLSYNIGGHVLHTILWKNLKPASEKKEIPTNLEKAILREFGTVQEFKSEFTQLANSVEGSGWGSLVYSKEADRLLFMQIEKHNANLLPSFKILMLIDVWEHAYYIDYRNERSKYVDSFWEVVDWEEVGERLAEVKQ